jgi:hypothetical protein
MEFNDYCKNGRFKRKNYLAKFIDKIARMIIK